MAENLTYNELLDLLCENGIFDVVSRVEAIARVRRLKDSDRIVRDYLARKNRQQEDEEPVEVQRIDNSNENSNRRAQECVDQRKVTAKRTSELEKLRREKAELERRFNQMIDSITKVLNSFRGSSTSANSAKLNDQFSQQSTSASTSNWQEVANTASTSQPPRRNVQLEMNDSNNERRARNQSDSKSSEQHLMNALNEQQQHLFMLLNSMPAGRANRIGTTLNNHRFLSRMNKPLFQKRPRYSPYQNRLLHHELLKNRSITRQIILELVDKTQLSYRQIYKWFGVRIRERINDDANAMFAAAGCSFW